MGLGLGLGLGMGMGLGYLDRGIAEARADGTGVELALGGGYLDHAAGLEVVRREGHVEPQGPAPLAGAVEGHGQGVLDHRGGVGTDEVARAARPCGGGGRRSTKDQFRAGGEVRPRALLGAEAQGHRVQVLRVGPEVDAQARDRRVLRVLDAELCWVLGGCLAFRISQGTES